MILVTGGAGYIGSHTVKHLKKHGYETVVFDNLSTGHKESVKNALFIQGDLSDRQKLEEVFKTFSIDTVIHFAASAYVGESVIDPGKYYRNNICNALDLLECMKKNNVKDIIFSSSCATYGIPDAVPITEDMLQSPISPYGMTKYVFERILLDFEKAYSFNFVSLRYFNAAGADQDGELGEDHDPETHVIPLLLKNIYTNKNSFTVFGDNYPTKDGTCIRDYIHVDDLADAHVKAVEYLKKQNHFNFINLGTGVGISVLELIAAAEKITEKKANVKICDRRPGDPAELIASYQRAQTELGWIPEHSSIENIVLTAWRWVVKNGCTNE
jgi:UDP-glucose 4-epimerase